MKFTTLGQSTYKDANGNSISSELIEFISPYKHICDGFYEWQCGNCGAKHQNRSCGWPIAGQVLMCDDSSSMGGSPTGCEKMNLLVKTNTIELDEYFGQHLQLERREKDIKEKENKLDEYIHKEHWAEIVKVLKKVSEFNNQFGTEVNNCIQGLNT